MKPPHPSLLDKRSCGCPILEVLRAGWSLEEPGLVKGVPAPSREVGTGRFLRSFPTQTLLWFFDSLPLNSSITLCSFLKPNLSCFNKTAKIRDETFLWIYIMPGFILSALLETSNGDIFSLFQQFTPFPRHVFPQQTLHLRDAFH